MDITEIRIKLMDDSGERLLAFCSMTFDESFVVRDLKIIDGINGPFVAMPSRRLTMHCPACRYKNHLKALYCNQCGSKLENTPELRDEFGRVRLYADIAHPIRSECREKIQEKVIAAFREEQEKAKLPGYVSNYEDFDIADVVICPIQCSSITDFEKAQGFVGAGPHFFHSNERKENAQKRPGEFGAGIFD
ncbi:MAG: septation protein SpoVG family protein [Thermoguttaceae bacterium]